MTVNRLDGLLAQPEPLPFFSIYIVQALLNYDITIISKLKVRNMLASFVRALNVISSSVLLNNLYHIP